MDLYSWPLNASAPLSGSSNSSDDPCRFHGAPLVAFSSLTLLRASLLLPLCCAVLASALRGALLRRPAPSPGCCDCFVFNVAGAELVGVAQCFLSLAAVLRRSVGLLDAGTMVLTLTYNAELFFHMLTCVERYLAVVRPLTYRTLRIRRWVRLRNGGLLCAWLFCFTVVALSAWEQPALYMDAALLIFTLAVVSYCSLAVLHALARPRAEGKASGTKRRAFLTIWLILLALLVRLAGAVFWVAAVFSGGEVDCVMECLEELLNLPSTLLLPLLILHREGATRAHGAAAGTQTEAKS